MGKFGKKTVVSKDLSTFKFGVMGPAGFGKTTLMKNVCDKLFGEEGYIILDMGLEDGVKAIAGAVAERIPNYGKLNEVVTDIVKNKKTDYPNLKVVIIDTLDAYFEVVEDYVIKDWNATHANESGFVKAKSINPVNGGFGKGMDQVIDIAKKVISKFNSVNVGVWWTAHVKEKEQTDLYNGKNFAQITANMSMKYFNAIKNSTDVIGCGYYDREIEKVEVGEKNPVTNKKKERATLVNETRKIKFRDDMLIADAKSRFKYIINEIPLDTDAFIKAIQDAINAASSGNTDLESPTRQIETPKVVENTSSFDKEEGSKEDAPVPAAVVEDDDNAPPFDVDVEPFTEEERAKIIADIRASFKELDVSTKTRIKSIRGDVKLEDLPDSALMQIKSIIDEELGIIE